MRRIMVLALVMACSLGAANALDGNYHEFVKKCEGEIWVASNERIEACNEWIASASRDAAEHGPENQMYVWLLSSAFQHLAHVYTMRGNMDLALENLQQALNVSPSHWPSYSFRGQLYQGMQKYDLAIHDFENVVRIVPDEVDAHYRLGVIYEIRREFDKAIEHYRIFVKLDPTAEVTRKRLHDMERIQKEIQQDRK